MSATAQIYTFFRVDNSSQNIEQISGNKGCSLKRAVIQINMLTLNSYNLVEYRLKLKLYMSLLPAVHGFQ
jgi:hypothetical protein